MKLKQIILFLLASVSLTASAQFWQEDPVPAMVREDFNIRFENPKAVIWKKQDARFIGANFVNQMPDRKVATSVVYSRENGDWIQTREELVFEEMPDSLLGFLDAAYGDYRPGDAHLLTTRRYGVFYEVTIMDGVQKRALTFDRHAKLVEDSELLEEETTAQGGGKLFGKKLKFPTLGTKTSEMDPNP